MLAAVENDEKLSRTNEIDQFQVGVFRFECKSQGCRDGVCNMPRIGEVFQVDKIDFPAKLLDGRVANSRGNGRLANAAGAEQCHEPLFSNLVADLADHRFAPNHHERSHGQPASMSGSVAAALRTAGERDDGADERVAPPLDVCDVAVAKLAVTKRLADRGDVDSQASLLHGYVRPDVIDQLLLRNDLTRAGGKIDQDIQRPTTEGKHLPVAPEYPFPARKLEGAKLQVSMNAIVSHG